MSFGNGSCPDAFEPPRSDSLPTAILQHALDQEAKDFFLLDLVQVVLDGFDQAGLPDHEHGAGAGVLIGGVQAFGFPEGFRLAHQAAVQVDHDLRRALQVRDERPHVVWRHILEQPVGPGVDVKLLVERHRVQASRAWNPGTIRRAQGV